MLTKLILFLSVIIIFSILPVYSQELPLNNSYKENSTIYIITDFELEIIGRTRPSALIYNVDINTGEILRGQAELEKYISEKAQALYNLRILKDNSTISYSVGEPLEDGTYPVTLKVFAEDSWNIVALPRPYYKTGDGFDLTIKARDYNFLGLMEPLRVDLGYAYDENKRSSFHLEILSNTPFNAFGYRWKFRFDHLFNYRAQFEEPFFYMNRTGVSMELPFQTTTFTFGAEEHLTWNEENDDIDKDKYGEVQKGLYMTSKLFTSWEIPVGIKVPVSLFHNPNGDRESRDAEPSYNLGISARFNHELPAWFLQNIRKGPFLDFEHSLNMEKVDWYGNFREGMSVSLSNTYSYNFYNLEIYEKPETVSFAFSGAGHFIFRDYFAVSSRLLYRQWFPKYYEYAGNSVRGIADRAINAEYMLTLNMDFPIRLFLFMPSQWFNSQKLRFFDFEFQISPVIDFAVFKGFYANDSGNEIKFNIKNTSASGGLEAVFFPYFMRSLYFRVGYAVNIREMLKTRSIPGGDNREFYLIMGHHY
jgi:hypothetical protein